MIPNNLDEEDYTDDDVIDLDSYSREELIDFIKVESLNVEVIDEMTDENIREAIVKAIEKLEN